MSLQDILAIDSLNYEDDKKVGVTMDRINAVKPIIRQYIAYWREYPDMFIDFLQAGYNGTIPENSGLHLKAYQRIFLRIAMRYKYVYCVCPRAWSKSFLSTLVLMLRCILFPGIKLFIASGGKQQSADIVREKVSELCRLVPALDNELDHRPGKTREGKDSVIYMFKNGSYMRNIAANERSRGLRMQGGLLEECASMDGDIINQVLIPMMNISRRGSLPDEVSNKSQIYINI